MTDQLTKRAAFHQARAIGSSKDRRLRLRWTDQTFDDYETVLVMEGWDFSRFAKNSVFLWSHNWRGPPLGNVDDAQILVDTERVLQRSGKTVIDKAYDCDVSFSKSRNHSFSHLIYDLYIEGSLRATSAGFFPLERRKATDEDVETYGIPDESRERAEVWVRNKLCEISGCAIPGNENAVKSLEDMLMARGSAFAKTLGPSWLRDTFHESREGIWIPEVFTATLNSIMLRLEGKDVAKDWRSADVYKLVFARTHFDAHSTLRWLEDHKIEPEVDSGGGNSPHFSAKVCDLEDLDPATLTTVTQGLPEGITAIVGEKKKDGPLYHDGPRGLVTEILGQAGIKSLDEIDDGTAPAKGDTLDLRIFRARDLDEMILKAKAIAKAAEDLATFLEESRPGEEGEEPAEPGVGDEGDVTPGPDEGGTVNLPIANLRKFYKGFRVQVGERSLEAVGAMIEGLEEKITARVEKMEADLGARLDEAQRGGSTYLDDLDDVVDKNVQHKDQLEKVLDNLDTKP